MISDYLTVAFLVFGGLLHIMHHKVDFRKITGVSFNVHSQFLNYSACFKQVYSRLKPPSMQGIDEKQ